MIRLTALEVRGECRINSAPHTCTHTHTQTHTQSFCLNVAPPKQSRVMILESGDFGRYLGYEGGALKNGD